MEFVRIVLLAVAGAIIYGLIHDQITARVCLEYFTVGHPRMFASDSPTLHALYWGVAATWWAGAMIGVCLALASRVGDLPKLTSREQVAPILTLLALMGVAAAAAGSITYHTVGRSIRRYEMRYSEPSWISPDHRAAFLADLATHQTSYAVGFSGGVILSGIAIWRRIRRKGRHASGET